MYHVQPDLPDSYKMRHFCRCESMVHKLKYDGTHRLMLDTDLVILKEPNFDFETDFQAMFEETVIDHKYIKYAADRFGLKYCFPDRYLVKNHLNTQFYKGVDYRNIYPYFNAGVLLIKEELSHKFANLWKPTLVLTTDDWQFPVDDFIKHMIAQYTFSQSLITLSDNWRPLPLGCNYLAKGFDINIFGKDNISIYHYCGKEAYENYALKHFKEYFNAIL